MIHLPHGCSCSQPHVNPKNYKKAGKTLLKKKWRITYYFRCPELMQNPEFAKKYPYGKLISIKGMNKYHTLEDKVTATEELIENELYLLKYKGFNPVTKEIKGPELDFEQDLEVDPKTPICEALEWSYNNIDCAKSTKSDLKTVKKYFRLSCEELRFDKLRIEDVRKKHIRIILENQAKKNKYTNARFNKIRAYVQMLFEELDEVLEFNPVSKVKLKKVVKKLKNNFTDKEITTIKKHLKENYYNFYRYVEIFFHSGCRSSELMGIQLKDVNLKNQTFKVLVKKRRNYEEDIRAINNNVLHIWTELIKKANKNPNDYLFSKNLTPGPERISEWQISKRWREHVKKKLGINKDFNTLKHYHTTKIINNYNKQLAAGINGHKSTRMNDMHYDLMKKERILEEAKNVDVSL